MSDSDLKINKIIYEDNNGKHEFAKNFKINPLKRCLDIYSKTKTLIDSLAISPVSKVVVNADINTILDSSDKSILRITPEEIEINTSTTTTNTYTFDVKSKVALFLVVTLESGRTLSYIPYIIGTARACVSNSDITFTEYDETDETYNYTLKLTIKMEEGYKYLPRQSPPEIHAMFGSPIGYLPYRTIKVRLITE